MTDRDRKPDMRNPQMSDARKAAEKKIGEAPFASEEQSSDASQSAIVKAPPQGDPATP